MKLQDSRLNSLNDYKEAHNAAVENPESFWGEIANTFEWNTPFNKVLEYDWNGEPKTEWFSG